MDSTILKKMFFIYFLLFIILGFTQTLLDRAEIYYFNGKSAFQTGEYKSAERFFEEALKLTAQIETKYPDIRYMLGWTKFYLKKYDEAQKYLKYYDDPKTLLALKSMSEGNIQEELHFKSLKLKSSFPATEATTNNNMKIGLFYYFLVAFVILFIVATMGFLTYFFVLKRYSFSNKTERIKNIEESEYIEEEEEESIPVEEILEVKIDELEELWEEYEKMKKKMDIDEVESTEVPGIIEQQTSQTLETNLEELNVDELLNEEVLEEQPTPINNEQIEKTEENKEKEEENKNINLDIDDVLEVEENNKETSEKPEENVEAENIEAFIEKDKMENLDNIETIKPPIDVITKYNKIMSEPEGSIIVSNIKGLDSLEKLDEEVIKKGGQFTKGDLHNIFKEIFAEKNRGSLMIE
ncbi:TPR repeat-containing protein [Marinitoga hydrogenitolerans DSM 16785]|uniref:TPR repeat-containing protein n=1 Tax=Marinitoga hydrogenitolerans (strain DSM 16785 / JCM 12826 / AT1271) TaxID=1122195 RepID=A0A1M4WIL2_MARH1|nr:tetratricopeptide repeat protein [Marinitoga hydrogenitolerans]SHE81068.1 TPR repeat-containing protein [Marinitoga hydrogenitolerans DSM 16785]